MALMQIRASSCSLEQARQKPAFVLATLILSCLAKVGKPEARVGFIA